MVPSVNSDPVTEAKNLVAELCRLFYDQGWVSGTGGGISVRTGDSIVMAPSGVQKERMQPDDMFVLDVKGDIVLTPAAKPPPSRAPKLSECAPLFMAAYDMRNAGAVIHSHSLNAVLATMIDQEATEFRVTHLEMIKGLEGHGFFDNLVVPIIENTARESELTDRLRQAIRDYPSTHCVLVRRHGVYVWGKDWIQAKTQAECYDYLFEAALRMRAMGIDASRPPAPSPLGAAPVTNGDSAGAPSAKRRRVADSRASAAGLPAAIVLDIEGTVAPITFVSQVLFPYAQHNVRAHLEAHFDSEECKEDIELIRRQAAEDVAAGMSVDPIPITGSSKEEVVDAVVAWVKAATAADRKVGALKTLQGHIWRTGFAKGELKGELYRDVPDALVEWRSQGIKTYIYSSGSRDAQRNYFAHSQAGDLRPYLSGFFDTTVGPKGEAHSYKEIALTLGVDSPFQILFATDVLAEAQAAAAAGWRTVLVVRPGNKPLPDNHGFITVHDISTLLDL